MFRCRSQSTFKHVVPLTHPFFVSSAPQSTLSTVLREVIPKNHYTIHSRPNIASSSKNSWSTIAGNVNQNYAEQPAKQTRPTWLANELEEYLDRRPHESHSTVRYDAKTFVGMWQLAVRAKNYAAAQYLARDSIDLFNGSADDHRFVLTNIMKSLHTARLPKPLVRNLVIKYGTLASFDSLPAPLLMHLVTLSSMSVSPSTFDPDVLTRILPSYLDHLRSIVAPSGAKLLSYQPVGYVRASFNLIRRLIQLEQQKAALQAFQVVASTGHIPQEIMRSVNTKSNDFSFILRVSLMKASIHWGWRDISGKLLSDIVEADVLKQELMPEVLDAVYNLLENPEPTDINLCFTIIRRIHHHAQTEQTIPDGLVRRLYDYARKFDLGDVAEQFYAFTQPKQMADKYAFPIPRGDALLWLLLHLRHRSKHDHLSRALVNQVANGDEPIPVYDRAKFITLAAKSGYALAARILWERYAVGKEQDRVIGDGATMVRMISLFTMLVKRAETDLHALVNKEASLGLEKSVEDPHRQLLESRINDYTSFIGRILTDFRRVHEPVEKAEHFAITSLARALILVGKYEEAFDTLRILPERRELPDVNDINVALTALAEYDAGTAVKLIDTMQQRGIQPNVVTFGTVLHHAILQRRQDIVHDIMNMARKSGDFVSVKSIVTLIRTSIAADSSASSESSQQNLKLALSVVQNLVESEVVASVHMGKYLVYAALRVHDPAMAFKFWRLLLKDKAEWDDREQRLQRRLIAQMIRKHTQLGWMPGEPGLAILAQLHETRPRKASS